MKYRVRLYRRVTFSYTGEVEADSSLDAVNAAHSAPYADWTEESDELEDAWTMPMELWLKLPPEQQAAADILLEMEGLGITEDRMEYPLDELKDQYCEAPEGAVEIVYAVLQGKATADFMASPKEEKANG